MNIRTLGEIAGASVEEITLTGPGGLSARILTFGARLATLHVPDSTGQLADIIVGHDRLEDWAACTTFAGATCGRYSNRIGQGRFVLDGRVIDLTRNEGANQLHGGPQGFDRKVWRISAASDHAVTLAHTSPDGDMGYPGQLEVRVTYRFDSEGVFCIVMEAETTAPTVVNMVNHAYFNMAGHGSVMAQHLRIAGAHYTAVDDALIPTGEVISVAGGPFDFRTLRPIGQSLPGPMGFDHNFCLSEPLQSFAGEMLRPAAEAVDPVSGRRIAIWTSNPGVQFYSGGYLDESLPGKGGQPIGQFGGFALETQFFPDSPNKPQFPSARLDPGQRYRHVMALDLAPVTS
ncbi:aldose epimerase family protein [Fuscibacter oryzae]|uniref:Aldose 1-epimerase n=1 Tax=Fuscibacter oryzae TaxID=2803939 RepID=A0A8J7MV17_9RHOB|nr:aldose epimerase family protein [Fuscibacter oryzae]MBL4929003.1 galactose mutarotase [Fuscibacter oryzae]